MSEKLWCVRFQESNGWFCSCAINMEYPTETLFIPESLSRTKQKEYNGRNLVNFLWEFPHFCISVKVLHSDEYQCTNFVISCVKCKPFVCSREICQKFKNFFLYFRCNLRVNDVFEHPFSVLWKMKNLSLLLLPLLLFFFVEPLVSYKNTDTRSWMEFSFICIVF